MPLRDAGALHLIFQLGEERYALEAREVIEVLPLQRLRAVPEAPPGLAGLLMRGGRSVPVLDLNQRACGRPALARSSTRLVLVACQSRPVGLLLEHATRTTRLRDAAFTPTGLASAAAAPWLGGIAPQAGFGPVQRIRVDGLLPPELQALIERTA